MESSVTFNSVKRSLRSRSLKTACLEFTKMKIILPPSGTNQIVQYLYINWGLRKFSITFAMEIYFLSHFLKYTTRVTLQIDQALTSKNFTDLSKFSCTPYINHANLSIKYLENIRLILKGIRLKLSKFN